MIGSQPIFHNPDLETSPQRLAPDIVRLADLFADSLMIETCRFEALQRRPGSRHVAAYKLILREPGTGRRCVLDLVAKRDTVHAIGKAAREFRALRTLEAAGFTARGRFRIPNAIYLSKDLRVLLQERARGSPLTGHVGQSSPDTDIYMRSAGEWLAKLHSVNAAPSLGCFHHEDLSRLGIFINALAELCPTFTSRLRVLATTISNVLALPTHVPATMVHGDYHPDHIFVTGGKVTVIDFERFAFSDPARDLGSFIAHMRTLGHYRGKPVGQVERQILLFWQAYCLQLPEPHSGRLSERIAAFTAHTALEALYYVACVLKVRDPERHEIYLRCAEEPGIWET